jgi:hypothetical protein
MRALADVVFGESGLSGVDYVMIAKKPVFSADWNALTNETLSAVRFLNNKVSKCKSF